MYQDGQKLAVKDLEEPVMISVPVSSAKDLESSCAGQPTEVELVNMMSSGKPGCLDAIECRYYDHATSAWSTAGCTTTQVRVRVRVRVRFRTLTLTLTLGPEP